MTMITISSVISFAQTQQNKPSQRIQQEKNIGATFEKTNLFSVNHSKSTGVQIPKQLKKYTILKLQKTKLNSLLSKTPNTINLEIPTLKSSVFLELVKVKITTDDFKIIEMPSGKVFIPDQNMIHYRGIVKGKENSIAAVSFADGNISGLVSIEGEQGNLVIGQLDNSDYHIMYRDEEINHLNDYSCRLEGAKDFKGYTKEELFIENQNKSASKCPAIFFDIDQDIVNDKGGVQQASNFIKAIFNQVALLYANDNMTIKMSGMKVWTGAKPFSNSLNSYMNYRNNNRFEGDLGHFVTYDYSGGVAFLSGLCGSYKYGVSGINRNYSTVPTYSWTVGVIAHELGHNFGSNHTHSCVWNGNNTAIDGCYTTEGGCYNPSKPSEGGTIMSYCHLTNVGINFSKGFGDQPSRVMRNFINSSGCITSCGNDSECINGEPLNAIFTNDTKCTLDYFVNNTLHISINEGRSEEVETTIGANWVVKGSGNQIINTFVINCEEEEYSSKGSCESSTDICQGVLAWSSNVYYYIGDKVTYYGNLFEMTSSGWEFIGPCGDPNSPCYGVSEWSANVYYYIGDRVTYLGNLFERIYTGWKYINSCDGEAQVNLCEGFDEWSSEVSYKTGDKVTYQGIIYENTNNRKWDNIGSCGVEIPTTLNTPSSGIIDNLSISVYPNPVKSILNLDINNLSNQSSDLLVIDLDGIILRTIKLNIPISGKIRETLDVSDFPTGIYFVQIKGEDKTTTQKIFKL